MPRHDGRDRKDFGQADYSQDYGYDPRSRSGVRPDEAQRGRDDYGQADYSTDWAYDAERGGAYRRSSEEDRTIEDRPDDRSLMDRAGDFLSGRRRLGVLALAWAGTAWVARDTYRPLRIETTVEAAIGCPGTCTETIGYTAYEYLPADPGNAAYRVLWAVIMERLEGDRRIDMRHVRVTVHDGEVTLDGEVRTKEGKRRIEDLVDVDGVRNVQNNLRPREAGRWTLF